MASTPVKGSPLAFVCSILYVIGGLCLLYVGGAQWIREDVVCDGSVTPSGFTCQEYSSSGPVRDIDQLHDDALYLMGFGLVCVTLGGVWTARNIVARSGKDDVVVIDESDGS